MSTVSFISPLTSCSFIIYVCIHIFIIYIHIVLIQIQTVFYTFLGRKLSTDLFVITFFTFYKGYSIKIY